MKGLLRGKVALITGAARGLGWGIARGFAQAGARVCLVDVSKEELDLAAAEIAAEQAEILPILADVSAYEQMGAAVSRTISTWGRLDILVSNAAILPLVPFAETTPEIWQRVIDVNLTGVYNGVKAAWPHMAAQGGGHCIAIASGASVRGFVNEVAYCAAKHGLEGMTKALAIEGVPLRIAVNTMGPGKRIKPTSLTRAEAERAPADERAEWVDPLVLAPAFVWLAMQPPHRFSGLRFDAGPIADTIAREGYDFAFAPEKVTLYVDEMRERLAQRARNDSPTT